MPGNIADTTTLNNGVPMPWFGLGVFQTKPGREVEDAVAWALEAGYRHIDTAALYGNEAGVGRALHASGVPRGEVFVTTKVWNSDQGYDKTLRAFDGSLNKLGFDFVDLYLVHWPVKGKYKQTWRALEAIYADGRARTIGVSNFHVHHLQDLLDGARVVPAVNQVEFHPYLQQPDLVAFCRTQGIQFEAWSPIMRGRVTQVPALVEIGRAHGKTAVQVTLRWILQQQIVTIPKSAQKQRIIDNADVFDFELSPAEMARIATLDRHERVGPDPDNFNF